MKQFTLILWLMIFSGFAGAHIRLTLDQNAEVSIQEYIKVYTTIMYSASRDEVFDLTIKSLDDTKISRIEYIEIMAEADKTSVEDKISILERIRNRDKVASVAYKDGYREGIRSVLSGLTMEDLMKIKHVAEAGGDQSTVLKSVVGIIPGVRLDEIQIDLSQFGGDDVKEDIN